jgi:hypothetical protein
MLPVIDGSLRGAPARNLPSNLVFVKKDDNNDNCIFICTFTQVTTEDAGKFQAYLITMNADEMVSYKRMQSTMLEQLQKEKENFSKRLSQSRPTGQR